LGNRWRAENKTEQHCLRVIADNRHDDAAICFFLADCCAGPARNGAFLLPGSPAKGRVGNPAG
jgi:hypothetical protein